MTSATILLLILLLISWSIIVWLWRTRHTSPEPTQPHLPTPPPECPCALLRSDHQDDTLVSLLQSVISSLDSGLVIVDRHARICFLNSQAETILGVKNWVVRGHGLIKLTRDHTIETLVHEVLCDGEGREMTIQTLAHERTVHIRCTRLTYRDHQCGVVILLRDITRINMLERSRNDMIANVSHELRTPLASLKLLVETLQSDPPTHIAHRMHTQMAEELDAINHLVDDLHELSQLVTGRVKLQLVPYDIEKTIHHALQRMYPQVGRKEIRLESKILSNIPPVLIDEMRIGQVLLNLLHNAIKYTGPGGTITVLAQPLHIPEHHHATNRPCGIQLPAQHPPGEWVLLSVQDTGIGIPSHDLTRIFERFYKVDRARSSGGSGLGLAIAKHLVEGHGGRLWAESEEGRGSTFFLTLPVADTS